jgi:hypothetical protein
VPAGKSPQHQSVSENPNAGIKKRAKPTVILFSGRIGMVAPRLLKALLRSLTPPKLLSPVGETAPTAKPRTNAEWVKLDAWPNIVSTWAYVLGEGNGAIEKAREEDRNAEEQRVHGSSA